MIWENSNLNNFTDMKNSLLELVEGFYKMKRWAEAKPVYEELLQIKPGDAHATARLAEVNKMLEK